MSLAIWQGKDDEICERKADSQIQTHRPTKPVTTPVKPVEPTKETTPPPPVKPTSPVVVAGAEGRAAAYGFAMAAAGFVGAVAL